MKIISSILILFFFCFNVYSDEESRNLELLKKFEKDLEKRSNLGQLDDKRIEDIIKEIQNKPSLIQEARNEDWLKKLRPFIVPFLIVLWLIFRNDDKKTDKPRKKRDNQSKIDEFIKKSNKKNKDNKNEDEFEKNFNDYFGTGNNQDDEQPENSFSDNLHIKIEERKHENNLWYFILGLGSFNLENKYYKFIDKENSEAKFTVYVFDITDKKEEIPLQGLIDPFKDENYLLSANRLMEVKSGYGYFEWTPMFLFPKTQVIPPYRGERKLKFKLYISNKKAGFENGNIINQKDLYYSTEHIFDLYFEEPGYLEENKYEEEVNEKIVQLGLAVAYSEKKINQKGVETIKSWINEKVISRYYFLENTEDENQNKIKYSFLLKNTYQLLKDNKLSLSNIVKELKYKSSSTKRYDAMNLLLNIAGSDDRLSSQEDKLLNQTARALELDMDRFQQMKTSTIANIDSIEENSDDSEETIFNFSPDMTDADKCKKLREEYTRWNRQTNNSNENIKNQAKKMVELTAKLRKKYNC